MVRNMRNHETLVEVDNYKLSLCWDMGGDQGGPYKVSFQFADLCKLDLTGILWD